MTCRCSPDGPPAIPTFGIPGPEPNPRLDMVCAEPTVGRLGSAASLPRLGVTHGIFDVPSSLLPGEVLYSGRDAVLGPRPAADAPASGPHIWRLERYSGTFPAVRTAIRAQAVPDWSAIRLEHRIAERSRPRLFPGRPSPPRNRAAPLHPRLPPGSSDGTAARVKSSTTAPATWCSTCSACYPGWTARLDGDHEVRIVPVDGGLQSIRLPGSGVTKVEVSYRPTLLWPAAGVSLAAIVMAGGLLMATAVRGPGASQDPPRRPDDRGRSGGPG